MNFPGKVEVFAISSSTTIFRTFGLMSIFSIFEIADKFNLCKRQCSFVNDSLFKVIKKTILYQLLSHDVVKGKFQSNLWLKLSIKNYDILPEDIQVWLRKRFAASLCLWLNCGEEAILVWLASPPSLKPTICDIFHSMFHVWN